jgi:hypothetical protein
MMARTSLAELQARIQAGVLGEAEVSSMIAKPPRGSKADAFDVYINAYGLRLAEFLSNDYPRLRAYVGEVRFNAMAGDYAKAHPSRHPNARWFGRHLPEFLRGRHADSALSDLAALEAALNDAFDAMDAPVVTMAELAQVPLERVADLSFGIHPSAQRLAVKTNVTSIWSAVRCGEAPPHVFRLDAPQQLLVWRQGSASRFRILGDEEAMAFDTARDGASFSVICEMIAMKSEAELAAANAAGYLRGWLEAEVISELKLPSMKQSG